MTRKQYIFGNWKMNNNILETKEFFKEAEAKLAELSLKNIIMGIGIPHINLIPALEISKKINIVAQNVYHEESGLFTGEISVDMLKTAGIKYCIVGHSERRKIFNESDNIINTKVKKLIDNGIKPIFCLGETEEEFNSGKTDPVCQNQIGKGLEGVCENGVQEMIIVYEPIWAIGTGKTATPEIAQKTIKVIRNKLIEFYGVDVANKVSILYGGSVNPKNIKEIMAQEDIDGVLVGNASLSAQSYLDLYKNK